MRIQQATRSDTFSIPVNPLILQMPLPGVPEWQPLLVVQAHENDLALLDTGEAPWLEALLELDWRPLQELASQYYQALWEENVERTRKRLVPADVVLPSQESQGEATQRLLLERPTGGNTTARILHPTPKPPTTTMFPAHTLEPGVVPLGLEGRHRKCFFGQFKAFIGLNMMIGKEVSAEDVHHHLKISPSVARACGFTLRDPRIGYRQSDIPSLRKLQQFNQIMTSRGLWSAAKIRTVKDNLAAGVVRLRGQNLAGDTTHYKACSKMEVVQVTPQVGVEPTRSAPARVDASSPALPSEPTNHAPAVAEEQSPEAQPKKRWSTRAQARGARRQTQADKKSRRREAQRARRAKRRANRSASVPQPQPQVLTSKPPKPKTKSQSRTLKKCRCSEPASCSHPYELSDPGAGTVVKGAGTRKMHWAHKGAVLATVPDGIVLDAAAVTDAASHDSTTLEPHLDQFFTTYPELTGKFNELDLDSGYEGQDVAKLKASYGFERIRIAFNRHRRLTVTEGLGQGMKSLSPAGTLTCQADRKMNFLGARRSTEAFLYGPPRLESGEVACSSCPLKSSCCQKENHQGRQVVVPFAALEHLDPKDPPMSRRFKASMLKRVAVERSIKRIKLDLSSDHLDRRGNDAFQAHLDRSVIALHLLLRLPGKRSGPSTN